MARKKEEIIENNLNEALDDQRQGESLGRAYEAETPGRET